MSNPTSRSIDSAGRFLIGTCGYSYPGDPPIGWDGVFYPKAGKKRIDELAFYASYFNAVEINASFYRPPSAAMSRGWLTRTPSGFIFAVKAWRRFTHAAKVGGGAAQSHDSWERFDNSDAIRFREGVEPLAEAGRLGALLFQYPPGFVRGAASLDRLEATLSAFHGCPNVVELRHRSWSDDREATQALLDRHRATWAFIDEPKFPSSVRQELSARGEIAYLRLHGRNQQKWWNHQEVWERYDYFYQTENIRRLGERLCDLASRATQTKFYVFFSNQPRGQALANALMLKKVLAHDGETRSPRSLMAAFPQLAEFVSPDGTELPGME